MSKGIFITGTGTDVGKTYVSGLILKKLNSLGKKAAYYKAAMSGNVRDEQGKLIPGDAAFVKNVSGISQPLDQMCPYLYERAYSPHLAARIEGNPPELEIIGRGFDETGSKYDYVVAEGSGGIVCPLRYDAQKILLEDVIRFFELPCLIVADAGLGTINHVVLTAEYMKNHGLSVKGIVFNHFHTQNEMEENNKIMCEALTSLPVVACIEDGANEFAMEPAAFERLFTEIKVEARK